MDHSTRRTFLKSLFAGSALLFVPSVLWSRNYSQGESISPEEARQLYRQARKSFYQRDYDRAETLYRQLLSSTPENILYYDGLAKVYGAQQKQYEAALLYKEALQAYPNRAVYYDRLAHSLNGIALGNRKTETRYRSRFGDSDLLLASVGLYLLAIPKFPGDRSLRLGLKDTLRSFDLRNLLSKTELKIPALLKLNIQKYLDKLQDSRGLPENRANRPVMEYTSGRLSQMKTMPRRELYFEEEQAERELSMSKQAKTWETQQLTATLSAGSYSLATEQAVQITREHPEETQVIGTLKDASEKANDPSIMVNFYTQQKLIIKKIDFWTYIGYASALRKENVRENKDEIISQYLLASRKRIPSTGKALFALHGGLSMTYLENEQYAEARAAILHALEQTKGCGGVSLKLTLLYARSYALQEDPDTAISLLDFLKGETGAIASLSDPIVRYLQPDPEADAEIHIIQQLYPYEPNREERLNVLYELMRIYHEQGMYHSKSKIREEILSLDPSNRFVLKYS